MTTEGSVFESFCNERRNTRGRRQAQYGISAEGYERRLLWSHHAEMRQHQRHIQDRVIFHLLRKALPFRQTACRGQGQAFATDDNMYVGVFRYNPEGLTLITVFEVGYKTEVYVDRSTKTHERQEAAL
jgi:hypothetical protein